VGISHDRQSARLCWVLDAKVVYVTCGASVKCLWFCTPGVQGRTETLVQSCISKSLKSSSSSFSVWPYLFNYVRCLLLSPCFVSRCNASSSHLVSCTVHDESPRDSMGNTARDRHTCQQPSPAKPSHTSASQMAWLKAECLQKSFAVLDAQCSQA
jgi:hypothetical protein